VLAGLTGAVSCFLAPVYWLRAYLTKKRQTITQAVLITSCALIQIAVVIFCVGPDITKERFSLPSLSELGFVFWIKNFAMLFLGLKITEAMSMPIAFDYLAANPWMYLAGYGCLVFQIIFLFGLYSRLDRNTRLPLVGGYLMLFLLSTVAGLEDKFLRFSPSGGRYYYVTNVLILLMIFLSIKGESKKIFSRIFTVFLVCLLVIGLANGVAVYKTSIGPYFTVSGNNEPLPDWSQEVSKWKSDPSYTPKIWPEGWQVELTPKTTQ
jgi:hypothetical protein